MPPTPPAIAAWVRCVKAGLEEQDPALLYQAFMTNVDRIFKQRPYPALHLETRRLNYKGPNDFEGIVSGEMGSDSKVQMCRALQAYLWLMESADPNIMSHIRPGFQQQTKMFFERMKEFMQALNLAFGDPNAAVLSRAVLNAAKWIVVLDTCVNEMFGDRSMASGEGLIGLILTSFHYTTAERTPYNSPGQLRKKAVSIDLANLILRLQNKMCSTSLSSAIFNAIQNFTVPLEHPYFKNPTLCTYYYYRGVDLLHDKAFVRAHRALQASYDLCHPALLNHRRKILIPLLATSIIVGRFPSEELIRRPEAEGLRELFFPVCRAISKGDFRAFRVAMGIEGPDKWKAEWWEQHRLHRLLEDRTNVLIWRSLIRKVYLITAQPDQKQPIVKIDDLWACAVALHRKAPEDINHDELRMLQENPHVDPWSVSDPTTWWSGGIRLGKDQVEGVVMSLLDQRLVRGYMARQPAGMSTRLVLGKADPVPSVWGVCLQQSPEEPKAEQPVGGGGGRVVRLSGVKAIGE